MALVLAVGTAVVSVLAMGGWVMVWFVGKVVHVVGSTFLLRGRLPVGAVVAVVRMIRGMLTFGGHWNTPLSALYGH
ncbi:MAG: hypothetical protein Q9O62_03700 [Ardenticatenia bacterium]|nr:hypothetical protein [Ardenticatenia bacterium]